MSAARPLAGRRALVTGSTQGIGFTLALGLARAGAAVIVNGRDAGRVRAAVRELAGLGVAAESAVFDVTDERAVKRAAARVLAKGGPVDVLVNNAGIQIRAPLLDMPLATWRQVVDTHLTGAFLTARAFVPAMIARGRGKVINICSLGSELARETTGPYTAAKGGLRMLTRMMCAEWGAHNIQANGIAPGYILTEMTRVLAENPAFDGWVKGHTPAGRWGRPEDLVGPCVFLASAASDFVNGQLLFADGGFSAISGTPPPRTARA